MKFYPAILSDNQAVIEKQLTQTLAMEDIDTIHFDILDGYFADNLTITPADLTRFDFADKQIDLHLMTYEPLDALYETRDYPDLPVRSVIAQVEKLSYQATFLKDAKNENWQAGLALNLFTPLEEINNESWENLDILLIMGIEAGFQGQKFNFSALEKVQAAAELVEERQLPVEILVDGGVKLDNIIAIAEAGADSAAIGSSFWQAADVHAMLDQFQQKVTESKKNYD